MNKEIGKAIKEAINIIKIPNKGDNTCPITNINLISPPPKDSFLNIILPSIIIAYINTNKHNPDMTPLMAYKIPLLIELIMMKYPVKKINTSSGIIIRNIRYR